MLSQITFNLNGIKEVHDMKQRTRASWQHHVFLIDKANTNTKLCECEVKFDNERDRQECIGDIKKHSRTR